VSLRSLQAVLRSLDAAETPATDGDLLRRFVAGGDAEAFAELVRRHGRLVWAVCRHLTRSDAEADDAFQATFLVLLRSAGKVRDAGRLSAWLHGVAYRVCAKARHASQRRTARERVAATSERNGGAVPDSAWDRALAAVHEEAGALPEALRVPFVLCCLEGKGVTEAAAQLGWKLGTVSGRLARAKDAILARLDARGLTVGAVAGLGLVAPPAAAVARAAGLARAGLAVPASVLQLSQGVIGMSATSFKVLAAAVLLTGGLGFGVGSGWVATADAQPPQKPAGAKPDPAAEVKRLQAELEKARAEAQAAAARAAAAQEQAERVRRYEESFREQIEAGKQGQQARDAQAEERRQWAEKMFQKGFLSQAQLVAERERGKEGPTAKTAKWDYDFVEVSDTSLAKFIEFLQDRESHGWEFNGMTKGRLDGKPAEVWVFRRPTKGAATSSAVEAYNRMLGSGTAKAAPSSAQALGQLLGSGSSSAAGNQPRTGNFNSALGSSFSPAPPNDVKAIEAEIARLQTKLAELKALKANPPVRIPVTVREVVVESILPKDRLPLDPEETAALLTKLAGKRFKPGQFKFVSSDQGVIVAGSKEVIDWATTMVKKLGEK
jgi:RNA polymerase sigma factor (sigma-70 family)